MAAKWRSRVASRIFCCTASLRSRFGQLNEHHCAGPFLGRSARHTNGPRNDGIQSARRGTIIVLALEAYRLTHGELPKSLKKLTNEQLKRLPVDPYSAEQYRYFPNGIPDEELSLDSGLSTSTTLISDDGTTVVPSSTSEQSRQDSLLLHANSPPSIDRFRRPGIWCMGPELIWWGITRDISRRPLEKARISHTHRWPER